MAHFARVEDGVVREVIVVADSDCVSGEYPEAESAGQAFIAGIGLAGEWRQTSYNNNFRGTYAGIGYTFDDELDVFVAPVVEEYNEVLELQPVVEVSEPEA
jgi:hypothetical protein